MENNIKEMIDILFDKTVDEGGKHDVVMDLASYDNQIVLAELLKATKESDQSEIIIESCMESMAEILSRNYNLRSELFNKKNEKLIKEIISNIKAYNMNIYKEYQLRNIELNFESMNINWVAEYNSIRKAK